jgi:penicillin-binding protein 2
MRTFDFHKGFNFRLALLVGLVAGASLTLIMGLVWRQLIAAQPYEAIERRQTERRIILPGPRGAIYDRHGRLLVGNRPHYSAAVYLDDLRPDFRKTYSKMIRAERKRLAFEQQSRNPKFSDTETPPPAPDYHAIQWEARLHVIQKQLDHIQAITGLKKELSRKKIIRHYNEKRLLPLRLVEDLSPQHYAQLIDQITVSSPIKIHTSTARYYPYKRAAAHTLGYVLEIDPDRSKFEASELKTFTFKAKQGKTGLEHAFNASLSGTAGTEIWRVDPLGFQDTRLQQSIPQQGSDLITSLDIDLQLAAETALGSRAGAAVAVDIHSGEILALASKPDYNLNELSPYIPQSTFNAINEQGAWLNRAVQLAYPPGSTFKLITSIAGLASGLIDLDNCEVNCTGSYRVGNRKFHCHARHGHGVTDLAKAIETSCNVFYYEHGLKIGIDRISQTAKLFGLHQPTGIELPYETQRIVVPSKEWKRAQIGAGWVPGDTANTAIGQGYLLVTPLQMAACIASIARGETRTQLTLQAMSPDSLKVLQHGGRALPLNAQQKAQLWAGMQRVVGPNGTGRIVQIKDFPIAGKTGTADFRAHGQEVNLAWFIGFAPANNPQIAVAVMVEGTLASHSYHGGSTAGPIAKDIFLEYIEKYPERLQSSL